MTVPPPQDQPQQWSQGRPQQWPQQQPRSGTPGSSWEVGPTQPTGDPTATRPSRTRGTILAVLAGVLVSALVVGGLTLANVVHWGSSSTSADTRAIDLPQTLGGLTDVGAAATARSSQGATAAERYQRTYTRTAERYRTAFDGAGVGVRTYSNSDLEFFLTVVAVRADSSGLVNGPQADPADLRVVAAPNLFDLVVDGDVQCLQTVTKVVKEGDQVDDRDRLTTACRTTAQGLTVYVFGGGGNEGSQGRQQMVDLVRAARSAITGS